MAVRKKLGDKTQWGIIAAMGIIEGERYYWMTRGENVVNMIPAFMVEEPAHAN